MMFAGKTQRPSCFITVPEGPYLWNVHFVTYECRKNSKQHFKACFLYFLGVLLNALFILILLLQAMINLYLWENHSHWIWPIFSFHAGIADYIHSVFAEFIVQEEVDEV